MELLVDQYAVMLAAERDGRPFCKLHAAAELAACIGRTRAGVEYMWGNVSSVLHAAGAQWVAGYKPRANVSRLLREIATSRLLETDSEVLNGGK